VARWWQRRSWTDQAAAAEFASERYVPPMNINPAVELVEATPTPENMTAAALALNALSYRSTSRGSVSSGTTTTRSVTSDMR
jgi:hypothetical protein